MFYVYGRLLYGGFMGISNFYDAVNCVLIANGDELNDELPINGKHSDNSYRLYYITEGNGTVTVDNVEYRLSQHQSFIAFPYSDIKIQTNSSSPWKYKWIEFCGAEPAFLISQTSFTRKKPVVGKIELSQFHRFFIEYDRDSAQIHDIYRSVCRLIYMLTYYIEYFPCKSPEIKGYAHIARSFIEQNYQRHDLSVKQVADYVKIDRTYLYRLFKDETGLSIIDYINSRRISRAESLLINKEVSVKDVAEAVGFSDQMYFSRVFKKFKGISPTAFRKNSQSQIFF